MIRFKSIENIKIIKNIELHRKLLSQLINSFLMLVCSDQLSPDIIFPTEKRKSIYAK